jgi:hypothetical protein
MKTLKQIAAEVRTEIKKAYPGHTFSVRVKGSQLRVSLMSAPQCPYADGVVLHKQLNHNILADYLVGGRFQKLPTLTESAVDVLQGVTKIANLENWDKSDSMIDYFNCNYYFRLEIGQWDKDFSVK